MEHIVNTLTLLVDKQQRQHECTKQSFEQVREQVEEINELQADVLYLDVGGIKFHTSRRVLMSPSASTDVLPVLFGADTVTLELDDGYTFFDRDSTWFSNVLSYLRQELERPTGGRCPAEPPGKPALNYYGLDTLFRRAQQRSIIMVAGSDDLFFDSVPFHHQVCPTRRAGQGFFRIIKNQGGGGPAHPQYANYWAPLTRKRHTMPHSAQSQRTNYWAPRTRKRDQQEHRPQRPTESSDPTQHAKGRTGDRPGPRKGATTRRNVTQGAGPLPQNPLPPLPRPK